MAKTARELAEIAETSIKESALKMNSADKRTLREPTPAMAAAGKAACHVPLTVNDPPLWLAIWRAMWDAAEGE